jgi:hypothetical protein
LNTQHDLNLSRFRAEIDIWVGSKAALGNPFAMSALPISDIGRLAEKKEAAN